MDPGFIPGFIGAAINILAEETLKALKVAIFCRRELKSLHSQLQRITPLVDSAQSEWQLVPRRQQDDAVKQWLQTLDSLLKKANTMVAYSTIPTYNLITRYKIAKMIERVSKRIEGHLDRVGLVNFVHQVAAQRVVIDRIDGIQRSIAGYRLSNVEAVLEPCVIGQELLFEELQDRILSNRDQDCCIGIAGMGGSGKTVLLKTVLKSEAVQRSFADGLIVWLTVSQTPFPSLMQKLGRSIAKQTSAAFDEEEDAQGFVNGMLRQRRFLITLDDVWEGNEKMLEFLAVRSRRDSKIVVTSRNQGLLSKMQTPVVNIIAVKPLTEEEGWELFKFHTFTDTVPPHLESIAVEVARECKGLPLAIKEVGAAMAAQSHDSEQWQIALEKLRNAEIIHADQEERVFKRLRLSFDALNSTLKACFLYFAAYKEDEVVDVQDIIFLWNYEGLLGTSSGYRFLQEGRRLLKSLINRSLIDVVSHDRNGEVRSCKVHDVMRDLALRISQQEEGCLFRAGKDLTMFPAGANPNKFQRISVMDNKISSIPDDFMGPSVCTFLLSGNRGLDRLPESVIRSMNSLRILDLKHTAVEFLPESIGYLKQLVCLRLSGTPIQQLPARSITNLKKLQVLDLSECSKLTDLPEGISKLKSLQILDLHACESLGYLPVGITALVSLQVLRMENCFTSAWPIQFKPPTAIGRRVLCRRFCATPCLTDLKGLTELKCLEIDNWKDTSIPVGTMGCFLQLEKLVVGMHSLQNLPDDMANITGLRHLVLKCGSLKKLPPWMAAFKSLRNLKLFRCRKLGILPALDSLKLLGCLEIHECDSLEALPSSFGRAGAFPRLKVLWLRKLEKLQELAPIQSRAMRAVEVLGIEKCMQVTGLPKGIKKLPRLKVISIYGSRELIKVTGEDGEAWETVRSLQQDKDVKILKERNSEWVEEFGKKLGDD